jgi:hypothetical protein
VQRISRDLPYNRLTGVVDDGLAGVVDDRRKGNYAGRYLDRPKTVIAVMAFSLNPSTTGSSGSGN